MQNAIQGIKKVSVPGRRKYLRVHTIPKVLGGLGVAIVSTSKGLMTDRDARTQKVGGEVIGMIW